MQAVLYASITSEEATVDSVTAASDVSKEKSEAKEAPEDSVITLLHAVKLPAIRAAANMQTNFLFITLSGGYFRPRILKENK